MSPELNRSPIRQKRLDVGLRCANPTYGYGSYMRNFIGDDGCAWDAAVGRESYGMQVILFFPAGGGGVRKSMLASGTRLEAHQELDALSDDELRDALRRAVPWEEDSNLSI